MKGYLITRRYLKSHYQCNLGALLRYFAFRDYAVNVRYLRGGWLFNMDWAFGIYRAAMWVKFIRMTNIDSCMAGVIMYSRSTVLLVSWMLDMNVFTWYKAIYIILSILLRRAQKIEHFTTAARLNMVIKQNQEVFWVVTC